jgi:small subunit ribosomal protein S18
VFAGALRSGGRSGTFPGSNFLEISTAMPREDRRDKPQFQSFGKPRVKITRESASGTVYVDYKDTETLRRCMSNNGKILSRKRTGANAMEQRMLSQALKRARFMSLLPYTTTSM